MHSRPWLWPNLLSLDAPIVALLWQLLFIRCFHGSLGVLPAVLLAIAVWLIYVADRMLDAWRGLTKQPRHEFYRRFGVRCCRSGPPPSEPVDGSPGRAFRQRCS